VRAQLAATHEIIAISTQSLALTRRRYELGDVAQLDVAAQEAALAQVQPATAAAAEAGGANAQPAGGARGALPQRDARGDVRPRRAASAAGSARGPAATLVAHRPDVRVAEAQLHAASAQIGVALANRLPQVTITAAYGGSSTALTQMFANGNPFWSLVGNVLQPLVAGGTLLHKQRAAEAAFAQAAAQYHSTVLSAFQNVADALYALHSDAEALKAAVAAEQAAKTSLDLTLMAQQLGAITFLAVLSAQQAYRQALLTRVQAQAARLVDVVALCQALGAGGGSGRSARPPARPCRRRPSGASACAPPANWACRPGPAVTKDDQRGAGTAGGAPGDGRRPRGRSRAARTWGAAGETVMHTPSAPSGHTTPSLRVLLVEDHAIVRAGVRMLLESEPGLTVVGEATTIAEALALATREQPALILLDLDLGGSRWPRASRRSWMRPRQPGSWS